MKRIYTGILSLMFTSGMIAQSVQKLKEDFGKQNQENLQKYDKLLDQNHVNKNSTDVEKEKSILSGFAGNIPVFLHTDDTRANRSANVPALQDGTLPGLNGTQIKGDGMNILVMDGGRIFEKHNEFGAVNGVPSVQRVFDKENGTTAYSGHPTNVAGIIGAIGIGNFAAPYGAGAAKGVLTKVNFDNYAFATTPNGNNYQKLAAATTANVSNHSYGINLGWYYASAASSSYPVIGWYWIGNYEMNAQDTYSGSYNTQDANFDKIVYSNPNQIVVKSAGNYYGMGPLPTDNAYKWSTAQNKYILFDTTDVRPPANCSQGYYCIGWGSLAKNIIVVGATNQLTTPNNIYTQPSDVVKASYSSAGPRRDGAIKPDLSAVGSNHLVATYSNGTTYNSYATGNGTSYAAPIVSGVSGAVTEVARGINGNSSFIFKADEMKALLTHTANEAGNPGPDVWFGWGFVDATRAAQLVMDKYANKAVFERNTLTSGVVYSKEVFAKGGEVLKASISWVDPAAVPFTTDYDLQNNHTSKIINDLDLRIIDTTTNQVYYPWRLDINDPMANATKGDNTADNIEQVLIDTPVAGRKYRVEVSNKGTLVNDLGNPANQDYALIVSGLQQGTLANVDVNLKAIAVYPTLTKDFVNVLIPSGAKEIKIYDISGKTVLSAKAKSFQTIDISKLPNGTYLIMIETDNGKITKKIIKN